MSITVELASLEIFGHHGVEEQERRQGQSFLYDIWFDVPERASSDQLKDTVDYREVAACVREVSDGRQFQLLEALAAAVADALVDRFSLERARVRVRKPQVALGDALEYSAASAERSLR